MTVASISLHYQYGTSDKVYKAVVTMQDGTYTLTGHWGRRGKTMQKQVKGTFSFHWDAVREMHNLAASKQAKGYRVTELVAV
jgi:predicted DNA-binding WGR domain protein